LNGKKLPKMFVVVGSSKCGVKILGSYGNKTLKTGARQQLFLYIALVLMLLKIHSISFL
jgi:hypothetical protein